MAQVAKELLKSRESVLNVAMALKQCKQAGEITSYRETDALGRDDMNGIDFYIGAQIKGRRIEIALQVKSSFAGVQSHLRRPGQDIYCVNGQKPIPQIKMQILGVIQDYKHAFTGTGIISKTNTVATFEEEKPVALLKDNKKPNDGIRGQQLLSYVNHEQQLDISSPLALYKTTDYDSLFPSTLNRPFDEKHIQTLMDSFNSKDLNYAFPVLVTENREIFDGHHRFEALKRLGLPVYYRIIKDCDLESLLLVNQNVKKWTSDDLIHHLAMTGSKVHILLCQDAEELGIKPSFLLRNFAAAPNTRNAPKAFDRVLASDYGPTHSKRAFRLFKEIKLFSPHSFYMEQRFVEAFRRLSDVPSFEYSTMKRQFTNYSDLLEKSTTAESYLIKLLDVYNYRRPYTHRLEIPAAANKKGAVPIDKSRMRG